jgi:hypothetical protein
MGAAAAVSPAFSLAPAASLVEGAAVAETVTFDWAPVEKARMWLTLLLLPWSLLWL